MGPREPVIHHSASLMIPNGDPGEGLFCPTLKLVTDSYRILEILNFVKHINPSLGITVSHTSASLVRSNGDPREGFFYPTLTVMIVS